MLAALMFLGAADVIGRYFLNAPVKGANEVAEVMLSVAILFSWAYNLSNKGHVQIELVFDRLPARAQPIIDIFTNLIVLTIFVLMVWQGIERAMYARKVGEVIDVVDIPIYPFLLVVPIGAFFLSLELIVQLMISFTQMVKRA